MGGFRPSKTNQVLVGIGSIGKGSSTQPVRFIVPVQFPPSRSKLSWAGILSKAILAVASTITDSGALVMSPFTFP